MPLFDFRDFIGQLLPASSTSICTVFKVTLSKLSKTDRTSNVLIIFDLFPFTLSGTATTTRPIIHMAVQSRERYWNVRHFVDIPT